MSDDRHKNLPIFHFQEDHKELKSEIIEGKFGAHYPAKHINHPAFPSIVVLVAL